MAETKLKQQAVQTEFFNNSMARQAVMNGNFDIWQRGTSFTPTDALTVYTADRWASYCADDGGTLPTLTVSRISLTSGDLPDSFYGMRLNANGAGTSLGANSLGISFDQRVEYGTRYMCGAGKTVTVSFWARSDVTSKKLGIYLTQSYGSGGSPTSTEAIFGQYWTLTSTWTKYSATFTTNTLVGKTFGTGNNDFLEISILSQWGSTFATYVGDSVAESYVGSGNTDIAQVQMCAGNVSLPFEPKPIAQELADCQRFVYGVTVTSTQTVGLGTSFNTTGGDIVLPLPVAMRIAPTTFQGTATDWKVTDFGTAFDVTSLAIDPAANSTEKILMLTFGVASGLTANRPYILYGDGGGTRTLVVSAEL